MPSALERAINVDSAARIERLVLSITDYAIFALDLDGTIATWNPGAERIHGYTAAEAIGCNFAMLYTKEDLAGGLPQKALEEALAKGRVESKRTKLRRDGTTFLANVVLDTIYNDLGEPVGFAKVIRDISDADAARRAEEKLNARLMQAQKLEAIGQLTGGIAHDFNNVLAVIMGALDRVESLASDNEALRSAHGAIRRASDRATGLIQYLLAFSRRQILQPKTIHPCGRVKEAAKLLELAIKGNVSIHLDLPGNLPAIEVDPAQFDLAILNLGMNARDAMPSGGELRISARLREMHDQTHSLDGCYIMIEVADTGIGIPPENLDKVVDPFFTTKEVNMGSGLGLSQVYGFAAQSGGGLIIDSEVGKGTKVQIYLPTTQPVEAVPEQEAAKKSILMVEDDQDIAENACMFLEEMDYRVCRAGCAADALRILEDQIFDVIFTDVKMPGEFDGLEMARRIRTRWSSLPILITSGYADSLSSAEVRGFPFLPKPYSLREMRDRIKALMNDPVPN